MPWTIYILECADKTLYTGITNDMERRLAMHAKGTGAKYTRGRGPFKVMHTETRRTKSAALKRELQIKALPRGEKLAQCHINHKRNAKADKPRIVVKINQ